MPIFINDEQIFSFVFPAGESHVRISPEMIKPITVIEAWLYKAEDIMALLLSVDAIRRFCLGVKIHLTIPYFPYARQDRVCNQGEALSVKVMANLINSLRCDRILVLDPHSDVTPALIDNCQVKTQTDIIFDSVLKNILIEDNWALVAPDAGAEKKVLTVAQRLGLRDVFCASKIRDSKTGKITDTTFHDDVKGRKVLIVDDICDGGRTFIELGKLLREKQAETIYLYITHGIFSKGLQVLNPYFDHIYCYHSFLPITEENQDFITVISSHDRHSQPLKEMSN
ncbi:ribose-phosphate diphosphokinase [Cyanobacterium sp. Dongsha4]|uniref:ribose-phosphate diphosphokinase n=1 Tax=Cyanobacterium sp. DS4 TaxID=2878255 RepID=UPI002E812F4F|nr:ribose-phosphate diphosphokinase [Cyanobacterium sp. Dongsha4]WVL01436.1 ribose-phosphate diphosphokinase [Cyanobacterium sp. Dongsha4]